MTDIWGPLGVMCKVKENEVLNILVDWMMVCKFWSERYPRSVCDQISVLLRYL